MPSETRTCRRAGESMRAWYGTGSAGRQIGRAQRAPLSDDLTLSGTPGDRQSTRPRVLQALARPEPRGRREANGQGHARCTSGPQTANDGAPFAHRPKLPVARRQRTTPPARSSARQRARWPANRSSVRRRLLARVRRMPHGNAAADADASWDGRREREQLSRFGAAGEASGAACHAGAAERAARCSQRCAQRCATVEQACVQPCMTMRAALRDPRCSPNDEQLRDKSRAGCATKGAQAARR